MILGIYYLSQEPMTDKSAGYFVDVDAIEFALASDKLKFIARLYQELKLLMKMVIKN